MQKNAEKCRILLKFPFKQISKWKSNVFFSKVIFECLRWTQVATQRGSIEKQYPLWRKKITPPGSGQVTWLIIEWWNQEDYHLWWPSLFPKDGNRTIAEFWQISHHYSRFKPFKFWERKILKTNFQGDETKWKMISMTS